MLADRQRESERSLCRLAARWLDLDPPSPRRPRRWIGPNRRSHRSGRFDRPAGRSSPRRVHAAGGSHFDAFPRPATWSITTRRAACRSVTVALFESFISRSSLSHTVLATFGVVPLGRPDAHPRPAARIRKTRSDRPSDISHLALCLDHRCRDLPDALPSSPVRAAEAIACRSPQPPRDPKRLRGSVVRRDASLATNEPLRCGKFWYTTQPINQSSKHCIS